MSSIRSQGSERGVRLPRLGLHFPEALEPFQVALHPDIDEADDQDQGEDQDLAQYEETHAVFLEDGRPGEEDRDFHVENEENERDNIEADVELDPRGSD